MGVTEFIRKFNEAHKAFLLALGDDVQMKPIKLYVVFRHIKNVACVEVHPQSRAILACVKADQDTVTLTPGFTCGMCTIGHFSTDVFERAKPLLLQSYEAS